MIEITKPQQTYWKAIGVSTMGPAFVDLTYLLKSNIQDVSLAPTVVSIGNIIGTLCESTPP